MKKLLLVFGLMVLAMGAFAQGMTVQPYEPGEGLQFESPDGYGIRFTGFVQPMVEVKTYTKMPELPAYTRFRMRRMVSRMTGYAAQNKIAYQLQVDLTGSSDAGGDATANQYLMDAWVAWRPSRSVEITFGQDNTPTDSREMGQLSSGLALVERSPVALAFSTIREFGLFANFRQKLGEQALILPALAITNGDGANVFGKDHGGLKYGGRVDFLPFGTFARLGQFRQPDLERERTLKLVIGGYYSYNTGVSDRRGRESGSILYLDSSGREALPDYQKFGIDFMAKYRGIMLMGEYLKATATVPGSINQRVRNDGSTATTFPVATSTGEVQDIAAYVKNRMILGSGLTLQGGYFFRNGLSLDARFARLVPAKYSFLTNPTFYNRSEYYTLGASYYLGRNYGAKVQASATLIQPKGDASTPTGERISSKEISAILMFTFSL